MNLSKSRYCVGMQCPKILWLDRNMPEKRAEQDETRLITGNMVGDLAMGYFGEYTEVPFNPEDFGAMVRKTQMLLNDGTAVIAEATFADDKNICMVDILHKAENGCEIIEVKSSTGLIEDSSAAVSEVYLNDMAYQYYVVTKCGLVVSKVSLMRLNKDYIRRGKLDLQKLFVLTDCTEIVLQMQSEVPANISHIIAEASQETEPNYTIGTHCFGCAYENWCFRNLPENNVFSIGWRLNSKKKDEAYQSGCITFSDVLNNSFKLNSKQQRQVETTLYNLPPYIEPENIRQFLSGLAYPLYHLDFETYQQVIPLWDGIKPFQMIAFQYSLHIQDSPCAEPEHKEFLGKEGTDPRRELAEKLCADIPKKACVLAYFAAFEKSRLQELAEAYPDLAEHLIGIRDNIIDLAEPFSKGYYYCREMGGSFSIKVVLPALCGNDPELDYKQLDLIHNGGEAMAAFSSLHEKPPEEREKLRAALLAYCKLDTLAMVKILKRLYEVV